MPQITHTDYYSHILEMNIKIEVTGHFGYPIIMFPTSQGSYTQNFDFHLNGSISHFTNNGILKLFNLQTIDDITFYDTNISAYERIRRYELYIQFLVQEYIPFIQHTHNTYRVALAGASFGGYHAANFAFRFPDLISHLFCMSGTFSIRKFMDYENTDLIHFNCPDEFIQHNESWQYDHMKIVLSTSDQDICLEPTRNMARKLEAKGIQHWYDESKWISHDWPLWRMVFPRYIETFFN